MKVCFYIARGLFGTLYRLEFRGRENIPDGAAMICSNHSSMLDPILISLTFGIDHHPHYIAKSELFKVPFLSFVIQRLGAISVHRKTVDLAMIKETLSYFKNGDKVAIFPEGTRSMEASTTNAKLGAVKIAERAEVSIVPIFIPRKKKMFKKIITVIGEPYRTCKQGGKRTAEVYDALAVELMRKIEALNPSQQSCKQQ
jgi:1-acyl-sn-glycerol-3-phosphate acyltransferase